VAERVAIEWGHRVGRSGGKKVLSAEKGFVSRGTCH